MFPVEERVRDRTGGKKRRAGLGTAISAAAAVRVHRGPLTCCFLEVKARLLVL